MNTVFKERKGFQRPFGARVRRAVELVAEAGRPIAHYEVADLMPEVPVRSSVHKYLRRAVEYGLLERAGEGFVVVLGWKAMIENRKETPPPKPKGAWKGQLPPNSVWEFARRAAA